MSWTLMKEFRFEAAHRLIHHDGPCNRLHGHSYRVRVYVKPSAPDLIKGGPRDGMAMDFGDIATLVRTGIEQVDHQSLNEVLGTESPTAEVLARWFFRRLRFSGLVGLSAVEVWETDTAMCRYEE